MHNILEKYYLD